MTIDHSPEMDPREPREGDMETFHGLEVGDRVTFFEWPVEPLTILARENDPEVGKRVRAEAVEEESFLYEDDGYLWHYSGEPEAENNPYPVQNLRLVE